MGSRSERHMPGSPSSGVRAAFTCLALALSLPSLAAAPNFESSHVHPLALTPSGTRLLAVNTPDAMLEVFTVSGSGDLVAERSIRVGLEPVSVVPRTEREAWVVNH